VFAGIVGETTSVRECLTGQDVESVSSASCLPRCCCCCCCPCGYWCWGCDGAGARWRKEGSARRLPTKLPPPASSPTAGRGRFPPLPPPPPCLLSARRCVEGGLLVGGSLHIPHTTTPPLQAAHASILHAVLCSLTHPSCGGGGCCGGCGGAVGGAI
jgi:hypothetical protein